MRLLISSVLLLASSPLSVPGQAACSGTTLSGSVLDPTSALIPDAALTLDAKQAVHSGSDGRFAFVCVADGVHHIAVEANGFARRVLVVSTPRAAKLDAILQPADVQTEVDVDAGADAPPSANSAGPTQNISGKELQSLADDPDDLLRELQQLASASGANPANVTIAVDGFQGSSTLPPKSSIAYIKVNPDMFSAEYREPPFDGARVEVYTKPGQKTFHGALFTTNGSPWENARDPFSTSKAAIGKQRYGFEFSGPVRKTGSDFALALEHRSIDNFAAVNAVSVDSSGALSSVTANVPTPQRLWVGSARLDWQLGPKNTFIASFSANVNHLVNVGVGGTSEQEAGYDSFNFDHAMRFSDITTASAKLMHESRLSLRWDGWDDAPNSTAPQVQVAGAFTSGGATIGNQQKHELNVELDDDAILTTKTHTIKAGTQIMVYHDHRQVPTNFNGTYVFGGGVAPVLDANNNPIPGQTTNITGVQQYQRALAGLPGGSATAFANVVGSPEIHLTQTQDALFFQDDWKVGHNVQISYGLRYFFETTPTIVDAITPRLGILWSPNRKGTWTLHAHVGMFGGNFGLGDEVELLREDGVSRVTSTIYNPVYNNPFAGATPIHSVRQSALHRGDGLWAAENFGGTRALPKGFNLSYDFYLGRLWNQPRSENVNSPLNGQPSGPRPGPANLNVLQVQNSGQGHASVVFAGIEQHTLKHLQFFLGGVRVIVTDDSDNNSFFTPQSSSSDAGEVARRSGQPAWNVFGNGTLTLPAKLSLSVDLNGGGDSHYNITTGFDNNGDGDFNDRPQYAVPGTPGAVPTRWGLLVASGGIGVFGRNKGVLPWTFHVDMNLQREFKMTRNAKADHQQTLTLNVRSANVINHLNVTAVGGVLGSPLFGVPYAADNGRRVEAGVRYSF